MIMNGNHKENENIEGGTMSSIFSYEGLMESITYCESIKDDPSKWESVDDFNLRLYKEFPWLK